MTFPSPLLEIDLFGTPRILLDRQPVEGLRRKNRALLFYVAATGKRIQRDTVLAFFWPDHERAASQPILRTMVYDLRKQLGEAFQVDDHSLSLSTDAYIDVHMLLSTIDSPHPDLQKLSDALALYKGDFLEGFSLEDASQFEEWSQSERERYRLAVIRGHTKLAGFYEERQDYPSALDHMRQALAFNVFQEDLQREVMRLLYLNGDRAGVVRQYEFLLKLLDEEMGVLPMVETRKLYDAIITDAYSPSPLPSLQPPVTEIFPKNEFILPFLGRKAELDTLSGCLGQGKLILLEGEAGIGKTRLFAELAASQAKKDRSLLSIHGTAYELEQGLPYQPILDALRDLRSCSEWESVSKRLDLAPIWWTELSRLLPEVLLDHPGLPKPDSAISETRLWEALLQFFRSLSEQYTLWLFIDDLHWADGSTIAWLGYLVRHLTTPSLTVIAASRPLDGNQLELTKLLQALKREARLEYLQLSGLPDAAMQAIAAQLKPGREGELSNWLISNAEGNPFFLTELIRYAESTDLLADKAERIQGSFDASLTIPATIQNLIESRLLQLSDQARELIHLASVIGREFDLELVRHAITISEEGLVAAVEELQSAHLVRPLQGEEYAFDHSLTMQVALQDMSQPRRLALHRQTARALEALHQNDLDSISGLLARHYLEGNLPALAATHAYRAGQLAVRIAAWGEAIAFFEQAGELESDPARQARIYLAMGMARFHKGDLEASSKDYRTAVDLALEQRDWPLLEAAHLALNQSLMPQTRFSEAIQLAKELRLSGPAELAAAAEFCWGTGLGIESAHPVEAEAHLREAERMVLALGEGSTLVSLAQIHYQLAGVVGQLGRSQEAIDLYRGVLEKVEAGQATIDILRNIMLYNNLAYHLHLMGDPTATRYIEAGIRLAHEKGSLTHIPFLYSTSGEIALDENRLDDAEKLFQEGLIIAEQTPMPERIAGMKANLGLVASRRGDMTLAIQRLSEALVLTRQVGSHHLEVRILIWLAPLLPHQERQDCLDTARTIAEQAGLKALLEEIRGLEQE